MPSRRLLLSPVFVVLLAATGCRDAKIAAYRIPKETPPPAVANPADLTPAATPPFAGPGAAPDMAATAVPTATTGDLTWTAPAHWQPRAASAMRKGTFIIPGDNAGPPAELTITAFPGDVGGNLANVNRWRGQLKLSPLAANELAGALAHLDVNDLHIDLADLIGPASEDGKPRQHVLGAIVPFNGSTWFFKLTGPDALVQREKETFLNFIKTVKAR